MIPTAEIPVGDRPLRELDDDVEREINSLMFEKGMWRFGGRYNHPYWRVILQVDTLSYDIALPGLFKTDEEAIKQAKRLTFSFMKGTSHSGSQGLKSKGTGARLAAERLGLSKEKLEKSSDAIDILTGKRSSTE